MKYIVALFFLLFLDVHLFASHIVGGDFSITMTTNVGSGAYYNIKLRLYRDHINANAGVSMPFSAQVGIYDASTHANVTTLLLSKTNPTLSFVALGDACYPPDSVDVVYEEGIFQSSNPILLPNNSNGYYIQYENFARNAIITNLSNPASTGITILAIIPDPSIGQNSSPDFGVYPADAYFCLGKIKTFNFPVTDPDGDSLVFSLVRPLNGSINGGGTAPGSGSYPYYSACTWANVPNTNPPQYNLNNIVGGLVPMTIDPVTGLITAAPTQIGYYVFAVRVEEYRNGVKLGEVRRDIQYATETCPVANSPQISVNTELANTSNVIELDAYVDELICFDVEVSVLDTSSNDTVFLQINSSNFDLLNNYITPSTLGSNVAYYNWENVAGDTNVFTLPQLQSNGYLFSVGQIPLRYCWEPPCMALNDTINIDITSYTTTCAGMIQEDNELVVYIKYNPQPINLNVPSSMTLTLDSVTCINLYALDSSFVSDSSYDDTLFVQPTSSYGFDFEGTYVLPTQGSNGTYYYNNFDYIDTGGVLHEDTTIHMQSFVNNNGVTSAIGNVALKYCWTVDCDYVYQQEFDLNYMAYSTVCGADTVYGTSHIEIEPPEGNFIDIPNVLLLT